MAHRKRAADGGTDWVCPVRHAWMLGTGEPGQRRGDPSDWVRGDAGASATQRADPVPVDAWIGNGGPVDVHAAPGPGTGGDTERLGGEQRSGDPGRVVTELICSTCKRMLPVDRFKPHPPVCYQKAFLVTKRRFVMRAYKRSRSHVYKCRECYNAKRRKPAPKLPRPHRCSRCKLPDWIVSFSPRTKGKGLGGYCKRCKCEIAKIRKGGTALPTHPFRP